MDQVTTDPVTEARHRVVVHLVELQKVLLALSDDTRTLNQLTVAGHPTGEIEVAAETIEQVLVITGAFFENMRGRYEARLALLRRGEPVAGGKPEPGPRHGTFWMAFSRLSAVVRRLDRHDHD